MSNRGREFHAGHLKGTVADENDGTAVGCRNVDSDRCGDRKTHRRVIGRTKEFGFAIDRQIGRTEQTIPHVCDDDHGFVE